MNKISFLLFISILFNSCVNIKCKSTCDYDAIAELKDPCIFINEFSLILDDYEYLKIKASQHASDRPDSKFNQETARVSEVLLEFSGFFDIKDWNNEEFFNPQGFVQDEMVKCPNFIEINKKFRKTMGWMYGDESIY